MVEQIKDAVSEDTVIVSIAAGVSMDSLGRMFGRSLKFVRCMPNTPALVGMGCTGVCCNELVTRDEDAAESFSVTELRTGRGSTREADGCRGRGERKLTRRMCSCFWRHSQMEQYRQECREHRPTGSLHSPLWEAQPWHLKPGSIRES